MQIDVLDGTRVGDLTVGEDAWEFEETGKVEEEEEVDIDKI
jgi:hypothetical protein